jgi:hypothetical protein
MSDYLGNIISRSLSMVDFVKPRLPSIFEPVHPFANSFSEIVDTKEQKETDIARISEKAKPVDLRSQSPFSFPIQPPESNLMPSTPPFHHNEIQQQQPSDSNGDGLHIESSISQNQGKELIIDESLREEPAITSLKPESLSNKQLMKQKTILLPGAERYHLMPLSKIDPKIEMHFHSKTAKNLEDNKTEQMPSVRVNIGRIEVRAIMPEPAKPRKTSAPATPKLSLEEYLKQRSGGQR